MGKWGDILLSEEMKKESVRRIISEVLGVDIKKEEIDIRNNIIYLNIKPIYKNEVLLKQNTIFSKLEETFGKKTPKSIR